MVMMGIGGLGGWMEGEVMRIMNSEGVVSRR